jgi:hypothetical protein
VPGRAPVEPFAALQRPFAGPLRRAQSPFGLALRLARLGSGAEWLVLVVALLVLGQPGCVSRDVWEELD